MGARNQSPDEYSAGFLSFVHDGIDSGPECTVDDTPLSGACVTDGLGQVSPCPYFSHSRRRAGSGRSSPTILTSAEGSPLTDRLHRGQRRGEADRLLRQQSILRRRWDGDRRLCRPLSASPANRRRSWRPRRRDRCPQRQQRTQPQSADHPDLSLCRSRRGLPPLRRGAGEDNPGDAHRYWQLAAFSAQAWSGTSGPVRRTSPTTSSSPTGLPLASLNGMRAPLAGS